MQLLLCMEKHSPHNCVLCDKQKPQYEHTSVHSARCYSEQYSYLTQWFVESFFARGLVCTIVAY